MVYCCIEKKSILCTCDVEDDEEYDAFKDSPPFINPKSVDEADVDVGYTLVYHTEGIYLN